MIWRPCTHATALGSQISRGSSVVIFFACGPIEIDSYDGYPSLPHSPSRTPKPWGIAPAAWIWWSESLKSAWRLLLVKGITLWGTWTGAWFTFAQMSCAIRAWSIGAIVCAKLVSEAHIVANLPWCKLKSDTHPEIISDISSHVAELDVFSLTRLMLLKSTSSSLKLASCSTSLMLMSSPVVLILASLSASLPLERTTASSFDASLVRLRWACGTLSWYCCNVLGCILLNSLTVLPWCAWLIKCRS